MYSRKPLHVAILWHQHQPYYKDLLTGKYALPWVRLHATKDYYDMAAILDEFPKIRLNFNLVPSLLLQLEDYASGQAVDPHLELTLKPAAQLTKEEKVLILRDFFMANWNNMIEPHERYNQLLNQRGKYSTPKELQRISTYFSTQDFLDLQVWFNLSWMDPYWERNDPIIKFLILKQTRYSEGEKHKLIEKQREICGKVIGKHRELQEQGRIEITTTPLYHPILPLIADTNIARQSNRHTVLPRKQFNHPEDAEHQISRAVTLYTDWFGEKPRGAWPSEGSVSDSVIAMFARQGFKWIATDEGILSRSLPPDAPFESLYKPYKIHNTDPPLHVFFRHRGLSDMLGFHYAGWNPESAANDIIKKLHHIRESISTNKEDNIIMIALDGENCWEYYRNDGWDFLRCFYQRLSEEPLLPTVRVSDYLKTFPSAGVLRSIFPGSWINSNFNIWIGHKEDNAAWDYLTEARNFLTEHLKNNPSKKDTRQAVLAWEEIYIAEGSDWCWWYGDDFSSSNDEEFDKLFRKHLMNVYTIMDERIPDWLHIAIKGKKGSEKRETLPPVDLITPKITGKISNYYEWQPAGFYRVHHAGGTMHKSECILFSFHYGFDLDNFYVRLDTKTPLQDHIFNDITFKVVFLKPAKKELIFRIEPGGKLKEYGLFSSEPFAKIKDLTSFGASKIIECAVPFSDLDERKMFAVEFMIVIEKDLDEIERWPLNSSVRFDKPTLEYKMINWSV